MTTPMDSPPIPPMPPGPGRSSRAAFLLLAGVPLLGGALAANAQVTVDALVTPLGGSTRYEITIGNNTLADLAIVSLTDAPPGDSLIGSTLVAPSGFLASYDGGLGIVDFLADTGSFSPGSSVAGFVFESHFGVDSFFSVFAAIDIFGVPYSGNVHITQGSPVPEPGMTLAGLGVVGCLLWQGARRRRAGR